MEQNLKNIHQDLIEGCKQGERNAQLRIYKLYYKAMFNTTLRIVNDTAEAEDIMQESFLDAFRKIDHYSGEGTFGSWLKRIVVNNALDALRKRRDQTSIEESGIDFPDEEADASEDEIHYQVQEIKDAINKLPEEYRIILSLYLLEGYDHEEISEILRISYNNSRTRYSRARQRLLQIIYENRLKSKIIYN
ncbi:MAG: sigma-70 family RNA polymerase sigma factor [Bacteroidetes bacterium]|nr:MAG: sigma-70 family RNA polymerase sigma factor [Bacteroidota bacterium]